MNASTRQAISRKSFLTAAMGTASLLLCPTPVFANESRASIDVREAISPSDLFSFEQNGNELKLTVLATGESAIGNLSDDLQSIDITTSTGAECHCELRGDAIYIDGTLAVELLRSPGPQTRAVPAGYVYLNTFRTNTVVTGSTASLALALLSLIPGLGSATAIASILLAYQTLIGQTVYIEVTQYYHPNTYYIFEVTRLYRNSNYTGLIDTVERGPFPPV